MDHIERIKTMEEYLNASTAALSALELSFDKYAESQQQIALLAEYYGSEEWYDDRELDQNGELPQDLRRGVLTEDLVYNLLLDNRELAIKMLETATRALKI